MFHKRAIGTTIGFGEYGKHLEVHGILDRHPFLLLIYSGRVTGTDFTILTIKTHARDFVQNCPHPPNIKY